MSVINSPQTRRPLLSASAANKLQQIFFQFISIVFLFVATSLCLIMFSYRIDDPSFRSATSEPAHNIFGNFGSHIADPLHLGLGVSYLLLVFLILLWSWRLAFSSNKRRLISRLVFFPLPLATTAIFLATYPPSSVWSTDSAWSSSFPPNVLFHSSSPFSFVLIKHTSQPLPKYVFPVIT